MAQQGKRGKQAEENETVPIVKARDILGELANRAGYGRERFVLTRRGKPIAAIVGAEDLARLPERVA